MTAYKAFQVQEAADGSFASAVVDLDSGELPAGEVLIQVAYSSLNFKDALSASGNKAVTRKYPHTPGIDAAGVVVESSSGSISAGDEVIVMGYDLGMNTAGGFGQLIRVPADWVLRRPTALKLKQCMMWGTAGFTAALSVDKLLLNGVAPDAGPVLVTGATGGVGIIALMLLKKLGFHVVVSSGKAEAHDRLRELGADEIIHRSELSEPTSRPLLKDRWAGAVDVVGGDTLFNVIKSLSYGGSVAACGLVQSPTFQASVFPFILRGVNLLGVDSVEQPLTVKQSLWDRMGDQWLLADLEQVVTEIGMNQLGECLQQLLKGQAQGRFVLDLQR